MPLIDHWKTEGNHVLPHLEPGEKVLSLTPSSIHSPRSPHIEPGPEPQPVAEPETVGSRVARLADRALTGGLIDPASSQRFFSVPAGGQQDSIGIALFEALQGQRSDVYFAVTDRRLLVLTPTGHQPHDQWSLVTALPTQIFADVLVRSSWVRLSPARLLLAFRDGSWLELTGWPAMGRVRAKQAQAALLHGTSSISGEPAPPVTQS